MEKDIIDKKQETVKMFEMMKENGYGPQPRTQGCPCQRKETCPSVSHRTAPGFYDEHLYPPELKCIKAAIPFLEPRSQKTVGMMVKLAELRILMDAHEAMAPPLCGNNRQKGMLMAVRAHLPVESRRKADILLNAMNMMDIMGNMFMEKGAHIH